MHDASLVRCRQALTHLHRACHGFERRQRSPPQALPQGLAFQQLEDGVRQPLVGADVEDGEDVGMVEGPGGARFVLEAPQTLRRHFQVGRDDLDRNVAAEPRVTGAIDLAHAARPQRHHDLVGAKTQTRRERHSSRTREPFYLRAESGV